MSIVRVSPSSIDGILTPPPSKSAAHRALLCAALAGSGRVEGVSPSDDMRATRRGVAGLGVAVRLQGETALFSCASPKLPDQPVTVDCLESGSTLRFLLPVYAARGICARFIGRGRLPQRPLGVYADCLPSHGITLTPERADACLPLRLKGRLTGGLYTLPGDISSQFISGLLFALPLCREDSELRLTTPLESAGYVEMTLNALRQAGIRIDTVPDGWHIPGNQTYRPAAVTVEADWSQAAFLLAAGALGGHTALRGLRTVSAQGDRESLSLFRRFGAAVTGEEGILHCRKAPLHGIDIDAAQIPDLVPVLAVTAATASGVTRIRNAARLRLKESDRLETTARCLRLLGADVGELPDGLVIRGVPRLTGGRVPGCGDHRIVMSMAVAALVCENPVEITDAQSVDKSWPAFFQDFQTIGGDVLAVDDR